MGLPFLSPAWNAALCAAVNADADYAAQAADWDHGVTVLAVELPEGPDRYLCLDLEHGRCRSIRVADEPPDAPAFLITGPLSVWRTMLEERRSPALEIGLRRLTFRGNWVLLARYQDAARTLVGLAADLDTDFEAGPSGGLTNLG